MSLTVKIFVAILTLALGIIPLFGNLFKKSSKNALQKLTVLGWVFISTLVLAVIFSIFQLSDDFIDDEKKDKVINKTNENVGDIKKSNDTIKKDIRENIIIRLENLDKRTLDEISRREGLLEEFRKVNETLERTISNEKSKIKQERPLVTISKNVEFSLIQKEPEKYGIRACFINTGAREAALFKTKYFIFETDENQNIIAHLFIDDISLPETIPASIKANGYPCMRYGFFDVPKTNPSNKLIFLLVKYTYNDGLTDKRYQEEKLYYWHSLAVDSLNFRGATNNGLKVVKEYLKLKKLDTSLD